MSAYMELFTSWKDVQEQFRIDIPEPEELIRAVYEYENYEGSSLVVYREGDKYYMVEAYHCSCHGLEDQWKPEEYNADEFKAVMQRYAASSWRSLNEEFATQWLFANAAKEMLSQQ